MSTDKERVNVAVSGISFLISFTSPHLDDSNKYPQYMTLWLQRIMFLLLLQYVVPLIEDREQSTVPGDSEETI